MRLDSITMSCISCIVVEFQVIPSYSWFRQSGNTNLERNESTEIARRSHLHASEQASCQGTELSTD